MTSSEPVNIFDNAGYTGSFVPGQPPLQSTSFGLLDVTSSDTPTAEHFKPKPLYPELSHNGNTTHISGNSKRGLDNVTFIPDVNRQSAYVLRDFPQNTGQIGVGNVYTISTPVVTNSRGMPTSTTMHQIEEDKAKEGRGCCNRKRCIVVSIILAVLFLVMAALALGLGFGLGYQNKNTASTIPDGRTTTAPGRNQTTTSSYQSTTGSYQSTTGSYQSTTGSSTLIPLVCSKTQFQCNAYLCIDGWRRCDGHTDCPNNTDELNCVCPFGQYQCHNSTRCIMAEWLCDREKDCPDGEDEMNCGNCSLSEFQCADYTCVLLTMRCDGKSDCADGSDESNCLMQVSSGRTVQGLTSTLVWLPICADSVPYNLSVQMCLALGMSGLLNQSSVIENSTYFLAYNGKNQGNSSSTVMASFSQRTNCTKNATLTLTCKPKACGQSSTSLDAASPQPYIVHGTDATRGHWPWQVGIYRYGSFVCGGSLVDAFHVVTAAHCMDVAANAFTLKFGSISRTATDNQTQYSAVKLIQKHPKFMPQDYDRGYDLSIVTLRDPVTFTNFVQPICIADPADFVPTTSICYTAGWGVTDYNQSDVLPETLQQAKMRLWSLAQCQSSYSYATELLLCAGYDSGYIAACPGDSGGPLMCLDPRGFWKLVGVFSFLTVGCNVPLKPSVFTNIQSLFYWLQDMLVCRFVCDNGLCLWDVTEVCNGVDNCGDRSDETRTCNSSISCSFETSYICGYVNNATLVSRWTHRAGPAGVNVGPIVDATFGTNNGYYMYGGPDVSTLIAPPYNESTAHCLQFKFHMRTDLAGDLTVTVTPVQFNNSAPTTWKEFGNQGDIWLIQRMDIGAGAFIITFTTTINIQEPLAFIAIDDVSLLNGSCSRQSCKSGDFSCDTDNCITNDQICNFRSNCLDESDERNCTAKKNYNCSFEIYGHCGLEQPSFESDRGDWSIDTAAAANVIAYSPVTDTTLNSSAGNYAYISTLYGNPGDRSRLQLAIMTGTIPGCFYMQYSVVSTGKLSVTYQTSSTDYQTVWSITGGNQSGWQWLQLALPVGVRIILIDGDVGQSGVDSVGYMALDDLGILNTSCPPIQCRQGQFACEDGLCINELHRCDGIDDCHDYSDEAICPCRPESFHCLDGTCLQPHVRCDGLKNCADGSDEANCLACNTTIEYSCRSDGLCKLRSTWCDGTVDCIDGSDELPGCTCLAEQFRCTDGLCIMRLDYCDGTPDCADAIDEPPGCNPAFAFAVCNATMDFMCANGFGCANKTSRCNFIQDCSDGSDESNCTMYRCNDGSMIGAARRCDGEPDCRYAEDELHCVCNQVTSFQCPTGICIPRSALCNGVWNCRDGADERNCTCTSAQFHCLNGLCIPSYQHCDGNNNCGDYSDEINCTCPDPTYFRCANGICLYAGFVCDNQDDCGDGSDEVGCPCQAGETRCISGKCIQPQWICDGDKDCPDGSDEKNCPSCNNVTQFTCTNYSCILLSKRCDGRRDCYDGSDEQACVKLITLSSLTDVVLGYSAGAYIPVCAQGWSDSWSMGACQSIGAGPALDTVYQSSLPSSIASWLQISNSTLFSPSQLTTTSNCSGQMLVRLNCAPAACGLAPHSTITPFVIGGDISKEGAWPWAAVLQYNDVYQCSASLIGSQWVVTAAHCVVNIINMFSLVPLPQYFTVRLGTIQRDGLTANLRSVAVDRIYVHPKFVFVGTVPYNDIALFHLTQPVVFNDYVAPVCLPSVTSTGMQRGSLCYAVGWGYTAPSDYNGAAWDLHQAKMEVWPYATCSVKNVWGGVLRNDSTQICAGYPSGYITMCSGDSGGPLMCRDLNNRWTLRGVVSLGIDGANGCQAPNKPTIFTNVDTFSPWIESIISPIR